MSKIIHEVRDNPEKIWLEPGCSPERCWSEMPLDDCEEHGCGAKAVAYVREDIVDTIRAVGNSLGEQLQSMIDNAGKVANLRAKLERLCDAAQAVIRVADRATVEFDGLKAAIASAHTADKPAHSAFANSENVNDLLAAMSQVRALENPNVVHLNMLRGVIAKPTLAQIIHLYGAEAIRAALPPKPENEQ